ncbi:acetate--CoA ligase [Vibrio sp. 10N.286.46.E10]|uniref:acetate--CoA ligase n=1 Tax=unclassified Vibrio TaxID=2614977 RepID=UPI000D3B960A|nr:acetate--CoA ligase [Vibrio sp. 10N.286.46.E10]PTQ23622.1 acetate--CoA ligase [Vibrio sp. 10N.286.46.E10]
MNSEYVYPVKEHIKLNSHADNDSYLAMYQQSVATPTKFWGEHGKIVDWIKPFTQVQNTSFEAEQIDIRWFEDGTLNVSANCIDRHLAERGDEVAIVWEGDDPADNKALTFNELHKEVCQFSNVLKDQGIRKGDVVCVYMPMVLEAAIAMLACTRVGAIHTVVFAGFSPDALAGRIIDSDAKMVITADEGLRGGRVVPLKKNVDEALTNLEVTNIEKVIVVKRIGSNIHWSESRDVWWHEAMAVVSDVCPPEEMKAEDPLFILYTSGSTGKPKGVLHTTGGYLVYVTMTFKYVFDYQKGETFWCTADIGWITGHSYLIYGPLSNGAKTLLFEGVPNYPTTTRMSEIVDKHQVNILYTAPTAIRALMAKGYEAVAGTSRSSLRIMGSVGEPINPEAWRWYYKVVGNEKSPIVDTWWQTETGGILIAPLPGATDLKPGSATRPFFGVRPALVDSEGNLIQGSPAEGKLVILDSWPGQIRTVYGDHKRFEQTYFSAFQGMYFTGDGARRDKDGYYWITGRVDDVLNVSGHRMGTAEIESALVAHHKVAEAAVVGIPHSLKGQAVYAYVILNDDEASSLELKKELKNWVRKEIGPIATPEVVHWTDSLPKTRSGKIMRRILREIATGDTSNLGDITTLADPSVVGKLTAKS